MICDLDVNVIWWQDFDFNERTMFFLEFF